MENVTSKKCNVETDKMDFDAKDNEVPVFKKVIFEPIRIGPVSTLDEMDCKVLEFQNKKLEMKLEEYQRIENELQQRIEQLERRQSQDTIVLNIVNRYWNHLNDDVKTMLLEFDDECQNVMDEIGSGAALAFIKTLAKCNETQIDDMLLKNVEMSTLALTRIVQTYDHIIHKTEQTVIALKSSSENATEELKSIEEFERLDRLEDGYHDRNDFKKPVKCPRSPRHERTSFSSDCASAPNVVNHEEDTRDVSSKSTDILTNSKIVTDKIRAHYATTHNEKSNCKVTVFKKSSKAAKRAGIAQPPCSTTTKTIESRVTNSGVKVNDDDDGDGDCPDDSGCQTDGSAEIDDSVRKTVTDLVERVASKFEFDAGDATADHLLDGKREIKMEGDGFADELKLADASSLDGEDETKFHVKLSAVKMTNDRMKEKSQLSAKMQKELKNVCTEISTDNASLVNIITLFQNEHQKSLVNEQTIAEALTFQEREYEQWKSRVDDIEYENEKLKHRKSKIERHLAEAGETLEKIKARKRCREKNDSSPSVGKKFEELEEELELQRKLAFNRSQELESLRTKYQANLEAIQELEKSLNDLPDDVIEESAEYKCLQSQYSVLFNDTIEIKDQIEEYYAHIQTLNATFANKLEMTETEDLMTLRKLQTDLLQMQQVNSQLRREYQVLKMEFERNLVANEQTGPLNKEMRHLLVRLQKHNKHLKHEAQRYKRKYKELNAELNMLSKQCYNDSKFKVESDAGSSSDFEDNDYSLEMNYDFLDLGMKEEPLDVQKEKLDADFHEHVDIPTNLNDKNAVVAVAIKQESDISSPESPSSMFAHPRYQNNVNAAAIASSSKICAKLTRNKQRRRDTIQECREVLSRSTKELAELADVDDVDDEKLFEDEYVLELRNQLKKAETEQKELKLLLDMYKSVNRDKREKMHLAMAEKKLKNEIEETKAQMRRILEIKRENRKKLADEDALRKIKYLEEQNFLLLRQINTHKQEEEALLSEMEVTNQAFEDMQEQNSRLIQQLREKDDANSKLMAERIKSNLLYKITREEKESLQALISATAKQLDSVTTVLNELEEKEQVYQTAINNVEKEINLRQQSLEFHRKKALEYAHSTSELKLNLEKYLADMKETKEQISETSIALDAENFKYNRLQEEVSILQRQVERMKKLDPLEAPDIVLVEQVREYKEMLTCQSCKVRRKDAVLSKCFHVFCWECLRTRYETRQRKCPKCNAAFGANDYHRLFFTN